LRLPKLACPGFTKLIERTSADHGFQFFTGGPYPVKKSVSDANGPPLRSSRILSMVRCVSPFVLLTGTRIDRSCGAKAGPGSFTLGGSKFRPRRGH
jgi:hypothetical protein